MQSGYLCPSKCRTYYNKLMGRMSSVDRWQVSCVRAASVVQETANSRVLLRYVGRLAVSGSTGKRLTVW